MGEGMLRIAATRDWVSGESSLPVSKRLSAKVLCLSWCSGFAAQLFIVLASGHLFCGSNL